MGGNDFEQENAIFIILMSTISDKNIQLKPLKTHLAMASMFFLT